MGDKVFGNSILLGNFLENFICFNTYYSIRYNYKRNTDSAGNRADRAVSRADRSTERWFLLSL